MLHQPQAIFQETLRAGPLILSMTHSDYLDGKFQLLNLGISPTYQPIRLIETSPLEIENLKMALPSYLY